MGGLISGVILNFLMSGKGKDTDNHLTKILNQVLFFYMIYIGMKLTPSVFSEVRIWFFHELLLLLLSFQSGGSLIFLYENAQRLML